MFSCFGKHDRRLPPEDPGNISPISNENPITPPNLKKNSKGSNSEREHIFLRAAHNGNFQKVQESLNSNIDVNSCNSNGLNALHLAAKGGHSEIVLFLIDKGADIGAKTRKNNTAIHIASLAGSLDVVKILIKHGANVNEQSQSGFTPLYMAAQENHVRVVKYLLDNGADINLSTTDNFTPLAVAIQQGHDETVSILLNKANIQNSLDISNDIKLPPLHIATRKDDYHAVLLLLHHQDDIQSALTQASLNGFTALHVAAYYNSDKVGRLLLENGAPVDFTSKNNVTALHVAAKWGRLNMVKVLLEFNANVELPTRDGIRPLHCAASQGHLEICSLLIEHRANCNARTKNGLIPLHMVAQGNHADLVEFFVTENSVNVNETSLDFLTPLHISSHCNNVEVGQALLKFGANVNDRALNGFIALHIATKQNHIEFVKMLMSSSCLIDTQTESGFTTLHIASIIGSEPIVKILVENNCEIDIPDQFDRTCLHMAIIFNHFDIVAYLLEHGANIDKQMKTAETSLMLAIKSENRQIVEYLINQGASMSVADSWGLTALHWAALVVRENVLNTNCTDISINEAIEIFKVVINGCSRYDINRTTKSGISSLHLAADFGSSEIVQILLDKGADVNIRTINGATPLHFACKNNNNNVLLLLLESLDNDSLTMAYVSCPWSPMHFSSYFGGANSLLTLINHETDQVSVLEKLHQRTPNGNTCFHLAVQQIQVEIIKLLIEHNGNLNLKNEDGLTVIDLSRIINDEEIIILLGLDLTDNSFNNNKVLIFQREEFTDDEQIDALYMDSLNELEFFGIGNNSDEKCELQISILSLLDYATTIDSIRRADMSLKINNSLNRYRNVTLTEVKRRELLLPTQPASMISTLSSTTSEMSPFDVEKCDYQRVTDLPINSGFLVSFLVDARGGYMQAQRMPQMKIFVPPDAAPAPTRIICHLLRPDSVVNLPGMNDCDGFASRILQIHSSCPRFQKPILIEMPHIALLKNGDRELVIMKKHADSENWKEHSTTFTDESLKNEYGNLYESITPLDQLESSRICRIITTDVPNYFSLISRFRRDVNMIGPDGGFIESKADKRIKLTFPQGALMKKIQISLEVQNVDPGIVNHIVGDNHNISMSPIITVEPKRRKFRDMIDIQMGLPKGVTKNDLEHLKLLFSISEYTTKWEDVTSATELLTTDNNCIAHATKISARVWMIYAPDVADVTELANKIYALHCPTPYVGKFLAYARRHEQEECQIRCILITDDTAEKTLECQENFQLIATGPEVEVVNKLQYQIECAGNIVAVTKSGESILFPVQAFLENRITLPIRVRNPDESFIGKIAFIPHFQSMSKQITKPVTTLDIVVPDIIVDMVGSVRNPEHKNRVKNAAIERIKGCQMIAKTELDLKSVADGVGADWNNLADELGLEADDINLVLNENCTDEEKAFMTLIVWQNSFGKKATGNELNRALRKIGREDVVKTCMGNISFVENEDEVKSAIEQLNDEEKRNHDECWDDIISTKNKPDAYNESVDESMIVETGDDWSQSHRESKLSDISDDKSLVLESTQDSEHEIHNEIKPIVDPTKTMSNVERTASEKTAAFLLLVDQLDEVLPAPVIVDPEIDKDNQKEVDEQFIVAMPSMSTVPSHLNYDLDSDLNESITPQRAGNLHAQPMVSDSSMEEYRKLENEYDTDDNKKEIIPLYENSEKTDNQTEVHRSAVPNFYDSFPLEQVNFNNETLINVDEIKSECVENDEETIEVDKIRLPEEMKQFEETDSHVNVVEDDEKVNIFDKNTFVSKDIQFESLAATETYQDDPIAETEHEHFVNDEEVNKFDENIFVSKDIQFESLAATETHQDDPIPETEHEYFINDEEVSKFEENSFVKKVVEDKFSIPAETHPNNSTIITQIDNIENYESPSLTVNVKSSWERTEINETDNSIDNEIIHQVEESQFSNEPVESWSDLQSEEVNLQSDVNEVQPNNSIIDNNEGLNQSEKHSILHEVIESDPQIQTEIEEEVEVLPDGTIVNRKITKRQISQIITEKITREIDPDDEESFPTTQFIENPAEVIETEEILPDGTILKRTISTSKKTTTTTSKIVTEKEIAKDENIADSSFTSKEPSETPIENVSANPPAKPRKNKNKKKGNKK